MAKSNLKPRKGAYVQTAKGRTEQDAGPGINELVRRFMHHGQPIPQAPWETGEQPTWETVARSRDVWASAQTHFEELPSYVRDHFENDPVEYFGYLEAYADRIAEDGLEAVLKGLGSGEPEKPEEDAQDARFGATDGEAGTEQTS